jgi:hypothetical protein
VKRSLGYIVAECCISFIGYLALNVMDWRTKRSCSCTVNEHYLNCIDYLTSNLMVYFERET